EGSPAGAAGLKRESLPLPDGDLVLYSGFLGPDGSRWLFERLQADTPWRQDSLRIAGKIVPVPRLQAWYGEARAHYGYSGLRLTPLPLTPPLQRLTALLQEHTGHHFNAVLLNCYRNGLDSVSWHSDDEPELGSDPVIASLSLGATRRFELRHKHKAQDGKRVLDLEDDSLLLMGPGVQRHWQHRIPKQPGSEGTRSNLTFR